MDVHFSKSGLAGVAVSPLGRLAISLDAVLRGLGQVMFQNNSYAGALFLAGIAAHSAWFALAAFVGSMTATAAAAVMRAERELLRAGMFGFNGALVAIALLYFMQPNLLTWACILLASAATSVVMAAMLGAFQTLNLPALTVPFVVTAWLFFLSAARFGRVEATGQLPMAGLPVQAQVEGVVTLATWGAGSLHGIGQIFFQSSMISGLFFLAGLLVASRRTAILALAGSMAGLCIAWAMGAAEPAIRDGAYGFNSALTAIALGSVFLPPNARTIMFAIGGAMVAPFVTAAAAAALGPLGMPAMTMPFVLTTWVFLLASHQFAILQDFSPAADGGQVDG